MVPATSGLSPVAGGVESSAPPPSPVDLPSWDTILSTEQALAEQVLGENRGTLAFRETPVSLRPMDDAPVVTSARQLIQEVPPRVVTPESEPVPIAKAPEPVMAPVARATAAQEIKPMLEVVEDSNITLDSFATNKSLLRKAWIEFDSTAQKWRATWSKPPFIHFGMLLKPALMDELKVGQSLVFQKNGQPAKVTRTESNNLLLTEHGKTEPLPATGIQEMLREGISSKDLQLFVSPSGDLILEATGSVGERLAREKS